MKKFSTMLVMGLCTMLLTTTMLSAKIAETADKQHIPVGDRAEAKVEKQAHAKAREEMVAKGAKEALPKGYKSTMKSLFASPVYLTHPGALHFPYSISLYGESVELEDGSIWTVCPEHAYVTLGWLPSDILSITPNHTWFSPYDYVITNENTGDWVHVNLYLGPLYSGPHTHWIIAIDTYNNIVYLEDGSAWHISSFDSRVIYSWAVNDTVIIGTNDGLFSSSRPNILINVNTLNYAAGVNYF